jgi:hypothetical protein
VGGDGSSQKLSSVELYNWKTGEQCQLEDLPHPNAGHTATVLDGTPAFCGGTSPDVEKRCYKFDKTTLSWIQVRRTPFFFSFFLFSFFLFFFLSFFLSFSISLFLSFFLSISFFYFFP